MPEQYDVSSIGIGKSSAHRYRGRPDSLCGFKIAKSALYKGVCIVETEIRRSLFQESFGEFTGFFGIIIQLVCNGVLRELFVIQDSINKLAQREMLKPQQAGIS